MTLWVTGINKGLLHWFSTKAFNLQHLLPFLILSLLTSRRAEVSLINPSHGMRVPHKLSPRFKYTGAVKLREPPGGVGACAGH